MIFEIQIFINVKNCFQKHNFSPRSNRFLVMTTTYNWIFNVSSIVCLMSSFFTSWGVWVFLAICSVEWRHYRGFRVRVGGALSSTRAVLSGVPKGPVLAPLLFQLYISDLPKTLQSNCFQYADDTKLFWNPIDFRKIGGTELMVPGVEADHIQSAVNMAKRSLFMIEKVFKRWEPSTCAILFETPSSREIVSHELAYVC